MKPKGLQTAPVGKNDVIEAEIDGIGYEGEGIAHIGGYTVFIAHALPGEKVRAKIIFVKPTFAVGRLESVLAPSPDRVEPFCKIYYKCGGCVLQHMSYKAQCEFKRNAVKDAFAKNARMDVAPDRTVASPFIKNYRNKMSLPVRGGFPEAGFFAAGTHRIVPTEYCPIQFEGNGELIAAFIGFLRKNGISGYNETARDGIVRHLTARRLGDMITVTAVVNGGYKRLLMPFDKELEKLYGDKYAYYINENTSTGNRILGEKTEFIGGSRRKTCCDGLEVSVHPHSFFQVNDGIRALLYSEAAKEARADNVIDAYSGAGFLSALLAKEAEKVTAVEIEPRAVEDARELLAANGVKNVETLCGDCAEVLPRAIGSAKNGTTSIVLDPPRAGCSRKVLDTVINAAPDKIAYISCNPATLARDAALLMENGKYKISRITPFDMFPQTANVETLVVLSKKIPDSHINEI